MIEDLSPADIEQAKSRVHAFGFTLLPGSIERSVLRELQAEAEERRNAALLAEQSDGLSYRARISSLGSQAAAFLRSSQLTNLLSRIFGAVFTLTESRSCLTFYQEGDHLGPHLDRPIEECVVTIIVYVTTVGDDQPSQQTGLELRIYGQEMSDNSNTCLTIPTRTGDIVIGYGSKFWHERPMLQPGEQVIALTGCYGCSTDQSL